MRRATERRKNDGLMYIRHTQNWIGVCRREEDFPYNHFEAILLLSVARITAARNT